MKQSRKSIVLLVCVMLFAQALYAGVRRSADPIEGQYIVTLKANVPATEVGNVATALAKRYNGSVLATMSNGIKAFGAALSAREAEKLATHPLVEAVEENAHVYPSYVSINLPSDNSLWALDRIDQRPAIGTDRKYEYTSTGSGVRAYVIDYGIHKDHREFKNGNAAMTCAADTGASGNRVEPGANFLANSSLPLDEQDWYPADNPCGGWVAATANASHGTAVASILGGRYSGVAKDVTLVPVKVGACSGKASSLAVAWGLDWVIGDMETHRQSDPDQRAVVNMSLWIPNTWCGTTPCMAAVEHNIQNVLMPGIPVVVSANNQSHDACGSDIGSSPARLGYGNYTATGAISGSLALTHYHLNVIGTGTQFMSELASGDDITISGVPGTHRVVDILSNTEFTIGEGAPFSATGQTGTIVSGWRRAPHRTITVGGSMYLAASNNADVTWDCDAEGCEQLPFQPGTNWGRCVDIYAPAWQVQVAAGAGTCEYREGAYRNGTSYAAPLVAGSVARLLQTYNTLTVTQLWQHLSANATTVWADLDQSPYTSNHKLLYISRDE